MKRLDKFAIGLMAGLIAMILAVVWLVSQISVTITLETNTEAQISPLAALKFSFSTAVEPKKLETAFWTEPDLPGRWVWLDERYATWHLDQALASGSQLQVGFDAQPARNDAGNFSPIQWTLQVREPSLIYLQIVKPGKELFVVGFEPGAVPRQLTSELSQIIDFSVAPDGEIVVFSMMNYQGGADLWQIHRSGDDKKLLLNCAMDRCTTPSWSPMGDQLAFTREKATPGSGSVVGAPRPWILNLQSNAVQPLYADDQQIGYGPTWSPDGQWLSIWNGLGGGVDLYQPVTDTLVNLASKTGDTGSWSANSGTFYFSNVYGEDSLFRTTIFQANMQTGEVDIWVGGNLDEQGLSYFHPVCNPVYAGCAVSVQVDPQMPRRELRWIPTGSGTPQVILADLSVIVSNYTWSADGRYLLYTRGDLSTMSQGSEIWVWDLQNQDEQRKITDEAFFPAWLN